MNNLRRNCITLILFMISVTAMSQNSGTGSNEMFDNIVTEANSKDVFSGSVLISKDGNIVFQKSIGNADYDNNIPNSADTKFLIGSITKFFTKTLIHQLAEENKINMSDNIGKYLSGFSPDIANNVTIQQLTDHTSGFGDYIRESIDPQIIGNMKGISDILPFIQEEQLQFTPGSQTQYSNSGYVLLANIVQKVEGKNYEEVLKEKIFDKLGMNNSGFTINNKGVPGKAKGYLSNQLGPKQDNSEFNIIGGGDGGIYSTTGDLLLFAQSITSDNKLLSDDSKLSLFNSPMFPVQYSSWDEFQNKGRFAIAGGAPGMSAVLGMNMEKNYIMVVLSNYDERTAEEVSARLSAVLNDREVKPFNPPPARTIYNLIKEKGAENFVNNYKADLSAAGINLDDDMILLFAGQEFLKEKDADNAIALYTVYTSEFPNIVVAWNDMGDAYIMKGDKDKAKQCYEQALKLRPENQRAKNSLKEL